MSNIVEGSSFHQRPFQAVILLEAYEQERFYWRKQNLRLHSSLADIAALPWSELERMLVVGLKE